MSEQAATQPPHEYQRFLQSLPEDWGRMEIRQLGTVVGGGTPSRDVPSFWQGSIPWVTPGEVSGNATKFLHDTNERISSSGLAGSGANLLPAGSLMVTTRATLGARAINVVPMATNQGFKSIVFSQAADSAFYFHLFEKVQPELVRRASGTTFLEISAAEFAGIEVPSPVPNERRLITKVLDTLDTAIHETGAIIAKLKAVKQGLLHDLLTRGIDANGELRPPQAEAPHRFKPSPLGLIPKEWDLSTVGSQFEIQLGKMLDAEKNVGVLKPYLGNKAVQWDRINLGEAQHVRLTRSDLQRFRLQQGDLLVCEGGEVGRAAIWDEELGECYYQKALHRLRPTRGYRPRLMLELLRYLMSKDALSEYISRTSIAHLTQEKLAAVPLPTPRSDEQDRLVATFLAGKHREQVEEAQLQKLRLLKSGLMDDLLTGRVRVTPLLADAERATECV
jgi:type I restriction enzyme S subunit